jgi:ATP-dependent Clp protease protease subunit
MIINTITKQGERSLEINSYFLNSKRTIFLRGEIKEENAMDIVQQLLYLDSVDSEDVVMYINSPGGSVAAGLAIYDTIKNMKCDVMTIGCGTTASMGALILSSGTKGKRYAYKHCEVMIHQIIGGAYGQATDVEIAVHNIQRVKKTVNGILAENTEHTIEEIGKDTERDYHMSAVEAKEYGLIDWIMRLEKSVDKSVFLL